MERRAFLTGTISAVAAGAVTLATDSQIAAFARPGDKASLITDPLPLLHSSIGQLVFMRNDHEHYVPIGVVEEVSMNTEQLDVTMRGDTSRKFIPGRSTTRLIVLAQGNVRLREADL